MAAKELMGWNADQKRWFKKYRGKMHAVSCRQLGSPPTKDASRQAANEWWEAREKELGIEVEPAPIDPAIYRQSIEPVEKMIAWWSFMGNTGVAEALQRNLANTRLKIMRGEELTLAEAQPINTVYHVDSAPEVWKDRFRTLEHQKKKVAKDRTISAHIKTWLEHKQTQALAGVLSVGRWGAAKSHLVHFEAWIGGETSIDAIQSETLVGFYHFLLEKKEWSKVYKSSVFVTAKSFIRSLGEHDLISLPGKLASKDFRFGGGVKKIRTFEPEELQTLLAEATEQTKLYLLLMLNCGMYQADISDLAHDEVDWKAGRICRKRSKTKEAEECPVVNYLLWPETFKLLKKFRSDDPVRVLVTAKGKALKQEEIIKGALRKTDNIQSAYRRLQETVEIATNKRKPLKLVRKTSATVLEGHKDYGRYVTYFLGHSPRTIKDKHYTTPDAKLFDQAVTWLGKELGLV